MASGEDQHAVETLPTDGADEPFGQTFAIGGINGYIKDDQSSLVDTRR
jgi:hypothetical protein